MGTPFVLLGCIARAVVRGVGNLAGFGLGGEVLTAIWENYERAISAKQCQADLQNLVQAAVADIRAATPTIVQETAQHLSAADRQTLIAYLNQVPGHIRRSLSRSDDPTGTTVPPTFVLRGAEDLRPFLPPRMPRFRPGDRPPGMGDWKLVELLGVGGFGEVWKATNPNVPQPLALKFCLDPNAVRSLRNEVKMLRRVVECGKHPGMVQLIDTCLSQDPPFLKYEYVADGELTGLIHRLHQRPGGPSLETVMQIIQQLAKIVAFAHKRSIVHRDLKPANILIQRKDDGKLLIKIADFGIGGMAAQQDITSQRAHPVQPDAHSTTVGGYSLLYASPQQIRGNPPDPRDDVHALGVIWYQILTGDLNAGRPAGSGWKRRLEERHMSSAIALLEKCLEENEADRPANAGELARRLKGLPGKEASKARLASSAFVLLLALVGTLAAFLVLPLVFHLPSPDDDPLIRGMHFVRVPKGTFWMGGSSQGHPTKQVEIKEDFELAAYHVTQEQWQEVMGDNPRGFSRQRGSKESVKDVSDADLKRFPVEMVSWHDVQRFLEKLNERQKGRTWEYRLPTAAEWEYACRCRAASKAECSFDFYLDKPTNDLSPQEANFNGDFPAGKGAKGPNLARTTRVGSYAANSLGLYDMHGNVLQWCANLYDGPGPDRVARGGCWTSQGPFCGAAVFFKLGPSFQNGILGFRVARAKPRDQDTLIRGMKFARVPKGTFWMGGGSKGPASTQVEIKQDFELSAYLVTQEQWQAVMGNNPSWFSRRGGAREMVKGISDADLKRFPVEMVVWKEVVDFLKELNDREVGRGYVYRLPTSAEWEYACRGRVALKEECSFDFYLDQPTKDLSSVAANFNGDFPAGKGAKGSNLGRTTKVGSYPPNPLGLFDMHGNLWQRCDDLHDGTASALVVRGGSWENKGPECTAAAAWLGKDDGKRVPQWGFRLARIAAGMGEAKK